MQCDLEYPCTLWVADIIVKLIIITPARTTNATLMADRMQSNCALLLAKLLLKLCQKRPRERERERKKAREKL